MTAGNRWSGSAPASSQDAAPGSTSNAARPAGGSENPITNGGLQQHHQPRQPESFAQGRTSNDPSGSASSTSSYPHPASSYTPSQLPLSLTSAQEAASAGPANLSSLDPPTYPYRPFPDRQLPPFGPRNVVGTDRGPLALPSISHPGIRPGDARSPFGGNFDRPASSSSTMARLVRYGGDPQRDHPRHSEESALYRAQPSSFSPADPYFPGNPYPRPGSSNDVDHFGIASLLSDRHGRPEMVPLVRPNSRPDGPNQQNALMSPRTSDASHTTSLLGYEGDLKRKRIVDDFTNRTRLPSLPGLSMPSLPPPPGFGSSRARSPSPLASSSSRQPRQYHVRDAPRSGFRLVGDSSTDIDQLDMDVDGVDGAESYPASGTGKEKEDARKEKNRDKQRRLRVRRANQLQSLENTVAMQEVEIKRILQRAKNVEDRSRQTRAIFSDWVDALENRLKELGEPDSAIESLRNQHLGPLNAYSSDYGADSAYRGTTESASSSNRISFSKEMSEDTSTTQYIDHPAPIDTRNLAIPIASKGNEHLLSPTATASLVSPSEYGARRPQIEAYNGSRHDHDTGNRTQHGNPASHKLDLWHHVDSYRPADSPSIQQAVDGRSRRRSSGQEVSVHSTNRLQPDAVHEDRTFTPEYLARLEEDDVFRMNEVECIEIARALARQRPPERELQVNSHGAETTERLGASPPWRDDFTTAQLLLLCRVLDTMHDEVPSIKERYVQHRIAMLSEHEKEVYNNWTRRPDRDQRIELLPDPVLRLRFIMHQESTVKAASIIAFISDWLHEAVLFGPPWLTHFCEMPRSFLHRWNAIWPKDATAEELVEMRRVGSYTGARPFEIVLGTETSRARHSAADIDLAALFSRALSGS